METKIKVFTIVSFLLGIIYLLSEPMVKINQEWSQTKVFEYKQQNEKLIADINNLVCVKDSLIAENIALVKENIELKENVNSESTLTKLIVIFVLLLLTTFIYYKIHNGNR